MEHGSQSSGKSLVKRKGVNIVPHFGYGHSPIMPCSVVLTTLLPKFIFLKNIERAPVSENVLRSHGGELSLSTNSTMHRKDAQSIAIEGKRRGRREVICLVR